MGCKSAWVLASEPWLRSARRGAWVLPKSKSWSGSSPSTTWTGFHHWHCSGNAGPGYGLWGTVRLCDDHGRNREIWGVHGQDARGRSGHRRRPGPAAAARSVPPVGGPADHPARLRRHGQRDLPARRGPDSPAATAPRRRRGHRDGGTAPPRLAPLLPLPIPDVVATGAPGEGYPWSGRCTGGSKAATRSRGNSQSPSTRPVT